jgi:hypothetical protein
MITAAAQRAEGVQNVGQGVIAGDQAPLGQYVGNEQNPGDGIGQDEKSQQGVLLHPAAQTARTTRGGASLDWCFHIIASSKAFKNEQGWQSLL